MKILHDIYTSLLADVAKLSGFREVRESLGMLQEVVNELPKLDTYMLANIEAGTLPDFGRFPVSLRRLARRSLVDPLCMRYLRQVLLFCYKAEVQYSDTQLKSAYDQFDRTNADMRDFGISLSRQSPYLLASVRQLCQSVLFKGRWKDINPSHGPGAVTNTKATWENVYSTIEALYPYSDYFSTNLGRSDDSTWDTATHDEHITAKLIAVPKDSRGPRLICVHPAESVWIQQGLRRELERCISLVRSGCIWPRGHVRFDDQAPNGLIALLSSQSGRYATIDLKEASDRISETLVQVLFGPYYKWFACCRAQKFRVGSSNQTSDLYCYAPMGNATTFPVQSLVFWAICVASLRYRGYRAPNSVFVFGDDLLVPSEVAPFVIADLESFGLLVNRNKTFIQGTFRESCGVDAYQGVNVTPLRWKMSLTPDTLEDLQSLSDLAQRLRCAGFEQAASASYRHLRSILECHYNKRLDLTSNPCHGGIAEFVVSQVRGEERAYWHAQYQRYVTPLLRLETIQSKDGWDDRNRLLEALTSLERSGRTRRSPRSAPRRTRLKRGWTDVVSNEGESALTLSLAKGIANCYTAARSCELSV